MTKLGKTLVLIIVILLAIGGYYYFKKGSNHSTTTSTNNVSSSSIEGCYVARLAKDIYTLKIDSVDNGNVSGILAFNNYEKDSSSGSFNGTFDGNVLLGNYSFDSEGTRSDRTVIFKKSGDSFIEGFGPTEIINGKESFKDMNAVTYYPNSTFVKFSDCLSTFTAEDGSFTLDHDSFFSAVKGFDATPSTDWQLNTNQKGILLVTVTIPRSYMPQTNFADARLKVGRSTDPTVIKSCTASNVSTNEAKGIPTTISGYPFVKTTSNDAGAGNFYETTSYRGIVNGDCYSIEYTIHSMNIGNYDPSQGIKEFDKTKIQSELEKIVNSFKFLMNSN